jgi:pyruvate dehydrogenase E1 component beta subunit
MRELSYVAAILEATEQAMTADPRVIVIGEYVGRMGARGTTAGLLDRFGPDRIIETPISEAVLTGMGVGAALAGFRPIVDLNQMDYMLLAIDEIVNIAAKWRFMSGGQFSVPLVVRCNTAGGRERGWGAQQSQTLHAWYAHIPGLRVVMPSTPADAKGLLLAAIASDDPVLFVESIGLDSDVGRVPEGADPLPIGQAAIRRAGTDVTVVATGWMVSRALAAADRVAASVEVIDPRTLSPLDFAPILESVHRTGRLVTVDQGHRFLGFGSEIVASVAEALGSDLRASARVASPDAPVPFNPSLLADHFPSEDRIVAAIGSVLGR